MVWWDYRRFVVLAEVIIRSMWFKCEFYDSFLLVSGFLSGVRHIKFEWKVAFVFTSAFKPSWFIKLITNQGFGIQFVILVELGKLFGSGVLRSSNRVTVQYSKKRGQG